MLERKHSQVADVRLQVPLSCLYLKWWLSTSECKHLENLKWVLQKHSYKLQTVVPFWGHVHVQMSHQTLT